MALSNVTVGVLIVSIDSTIVVIGLPAIFRGIHLDPLVASNTTYLLWMIMGFLIVTAVLVVSLGRLGDMFGRVRVYNCGFAVFTVFSLLLSVSWLQGVDGARWLIAMRIGQGLGGAMLLGNGAAIVTDAFPPGQRGMALGINNVAFVAGATVGLVLGGVLAPIAWRLIFLVSVPVGVFGTVWAYMRLRDVGERHAEPIDWLGNLSFALGVISIMIAVTTGIRPYGGQAMGWTSPPVLAEFGLGAVLLAVCAVTETRVPHPMFDPRLLRIRAFVAGNLASLLASLTRGGLQLVLVIWLQGIWLPEHGYSFSDTPLWAGIHMLPLIAGILITGPVSGRLSDRFGARPFTAAGTLLAATAFFLLARLPVDFGYPVFAALLLLNGLGMGLFISPNLSAVMTSVPAARRGVGAGMTTTSQNCAQVLSVGIFFSLMIVGLSRKLPSSLYHRLVAHGVPVREALQAAHLPAASSLFATFLGYDPVTHLLRSHALHALPAAQFRILTGHEFFSRLMTKPFGDALKVAFTFALISCLLACAASLLRGGKYAAPVETIAGEAP